MRINNNTRCHFSQSTCTELYTPLPSHLTTIHLEYRDIHVPPFVMRSEDIFLPVAVLFPLFVFVPFLYAHFASWQ